MHMAIGLESNVKLVDVGSNHAIEDSLRVPHGKGVLPHCVLFSFAFQSPGVKCNQGCILDWVGGVVFANLHAFMSLMNSGGGFLK